MPSRTFFCGLRKFISAQHDACTHRLRAHISAASLMARAALRETEQRAGQHDALENRLVSRTIPSHASFRAEKEITKFERASPRGNLATFKYDKNHILTYQEMPSRTFFCGLRKYISAQHDACTRRLRKYNTAISLLCARAALRETEQRAGQHDALEEPPPPAFCAPEQSGAIKCGKSLYTLTFLVYNIS